MLIILKISKKIGVGFLVNAVNKNIVTMIIGYAFLQVVIYTSIFFQYGSAFAERGELLSSYLNSESAFTVFLVIGFVSTITEEVVFRGFIQGYWFKSSPIIGFIVSVVFSQ